MDMAEITKNITPIIAAVISAVTLIIAGIIVSRSKKRESSDSKIPTTEAMWTETREARERAFFYEDAYHALRGVVKGYIRRVLFHYPDDERVHPNAAEVEELKVKTPDAAT